MREIKVRGHWRTYNGKKKWIEEGSRKIQDKKNPTIYGIDSYGNEYRSENLKAYAFKFHFSFPKGYVKKIKAENLEEAEAIASSECDSVLMDPENSGYSEYIGDWEDYKQKINTKRAESMKRKVQHFANYKQQSEELGRDSPTWEYPYKKKWKYLEGDTK